MASYSTGNKIEIQHAAVLIAFSRDGCPPSGVQSWFLYSTTRMYILSTTLTGEKGATYNNPTTMVMLQSVKSVITYIGGIGAEG